ncbi:MAG: hypothetical protein QM402_09815 [Synergistota bacterium]|nr:hypothetical protein [Synergistota bacterium]
MYFFAKRRGMFDGYAICLLNIGLLGFAIGIIRGNHMRYLIPDMGRVIFMVATYLAFLNMHLSIFRIRVFISKFSAAVVWSYSIVIAYIYLVLVPSGAEIHLGLGSEALLLPAAYYYWRGNRRRLLLSILLIVLSGKRGAIVALCVMLLVLWSMRRIKSFVGTCVLTVLVGILLIGTMFYGIYIAYLHTEGMLLHYTFARWQLIIPWSSQFDLYIGSGTRLEEIISAVAELKRQPLGFLAGGGHGFSYPLTFKLGNVENYHNVHFSPIGFFVIYGLPATILFYGVLAHLLAMAHRARPRDASEEIVWATLFAYVVGLMIYTFFAFELLQEPLLWASIGLLSAMARFNTNQVQLIGGRIACQ